ncbi:MAG: SAM-dependent methyltransferase [Rubrivivax sp.]|nr:SAM-dependent methyltransferase [Rubrivivax sp.]
MALLHPRVARNFIKNGYFPTDEPTLERICSALAPALPGTQVRLLDPCCGEGAALSALSTHLSACGADVTSFAVEIDEERAWHAKTLLDTVAHADIHDVRISERAFGLLFLNPPYGDLVADAAHTGDSKEGGRQRHEKIFCRRTFSLLQPGGVLVLIVPYYVLDADLATMIARHFDNVRAFLSPEQQFKQCVLFGVKRRPGTPDAALVKRLLAFAERAGGADGADGPEGAAGARRDELPATWPHEPYLVPAPREGDELAFSVLRLDARQLAAELAGDSGLARSTLWPRLAQLMRRHDVQAKPPLRAMSDWHLALALAAGQIGGVVDTQDDRRLLIKGRTHKTKDTQVMREANPDGSVSETRVLTDRFVTVIKAIDLTPGENLGQLVTIV